MTHFEADDRCKKCKKLILMEHEIFLFNNSPDAIRRQGDEQEWQPSPDEPAIPLDNGPHRVAYVWGIDQGVPASHIDHIGDPVVMVHEGPLEDVMWVPCNAAMLESNPGVWLWICQPMAPKNPITDDWIRSIST